MSVSVILPTYNRAAILRKSLRAYADQCGDHQMLEVLVVDDGSKDCTSTVVEQCQTFFPVSLRYLRQENSGLAAARNHGIRQARGDLILFGDDDIIPSRNMVAEHVAWHRRYPAPYVGVLGHVTWAPEVNPTPFMKWSGLYGAQFSFGLFQPGMELDYCHAYFCNTSVKSTFLRKNGIFDENFREYGWEDLELSYRLYRHGFKMLYSGEALGFHYKFETFDDTLRRALSLNRSLAVFANTDAGRSFLEGKNRQSKPRRRTSLAVGLLRPFKRPVVLLFRYLIDTRIPFPARIYEYVFYDYISRHLPPTS